MGDASVDCCKGRDERQPMHTQTVPLKRNPRTFSLMVELPFSESTTNTTNKIQPLDKLWANIYSTHSKSDFQQYKDPHNCIKKGIFHEKSFDIHQEYYYSQWHNYKYVCSENVRFDRNWPEFAPINGLRFSSLEDIMKMRLIILNSEFSRLSSKTQNDFLETYFWKIMI